MQELATAQVALEKAQRALADLQSKSQIGRPTAYRPEYGPRATGLCMLGYNNQELADALGVELTTISRWLAEEPAFRGCVYDGRAGADANVAQAMYKSAVGYEHDEDDIRVVAIGGNSGSEIQITATTKRYPPNHNSAALWLANRQREKWRHLRRDGDGGGEGASAPEDLAHTAQAAIRAALDDTAAPLTDKADK